MVCVTGFQLYKDANEFYFSFECVPPPAQRALPHAAHAFCVALPSCAERRAHAPPRSCRKCDGTGKLACGKCRGFGYLKKGGEESIKAFKQVGVDQDVSGIYLCPFCKGTGTLPCQSCRGKAKLWPENLNIEVRPTLLSRALLAQRTAAEPCVCDAQRMFKWRHVHQNAFERSAWMRLTAAQDGATAASEKKRKIATGLGGFKMSGSANLLPLTDEELAAQAAGK